LDPSLILAIEAATPAASAALVRGGVVLAERQTDPERDLSESLLPCIDQLLEDAGVALPQVEAFAVSIGPGSFTSLRVGLATMKGLAFGTALPAVAVPTLAALAMAATEAGGSESAGVIVPVLDAGRGELYAAGYPRTSFQAGAGCGEGISPWIASSALPESVYSPLNLLAKSPAAAVFVGKARTLTVVSQRAEDPGALECFPCTVQAGFVGRMAEKMLDAGLSQSVEELSPRYVRRAEAEARLTGQALEAEQGS